MVTSCISERIKVNIRYRLIHEVSGYQVVFDTSDRGGENFDFVVRWIGRKSWCIIDDILSLHYDHKFLSANKLLTTDLCHPTRSILRPVDDIALDDTVGWDGYGFCGGL